MRIDFSVVYKVKTVHMHNNHLLHSITTYLVYRQNRSTTSPAYLWWFHSNYFNDSNAFGSIYKALMLSLAGRKFSDSLKSILANNIVVYQTSNCIIRL